MMASTIVIVFPDPGLSVGRDVWVISRRRYLWPKNNEPGGAATIDISAFNCEVLKIISLLTILKSKLGIGIFGE